jgi:hypothetical protein
MAPHVQEYASKVGGDYDSDWLHRNEACQLQAKLGGEIHVVNAQSNIAGAGSLSELSGNIMLCIMRNLFQQIYMLYSLTKLFAVQVLILWDAISSLLCDILKGEYADSKELKR